jgi:cell fate (sporulation/competence/biofilm development) regulator YlbF (YheA/YmcA/DUF963 family)
MDEVLELAEKLSRAIARSSRFTDLRQAEKAVMEDEGAIALLKAREEAATVVSEKTGQGRPVEPDDKRKLADAEEQIRTNPALSELSRAQADFQEMLNLVNHRITSALGPEPKEKEEAGEEPAAG